MIRLVEQGMQLSDQQSFTTQQDHHDKICIIYDRRGLSFENIDPNLYQFCNKTLDELRVRLSPTLFVNH